jgi:NADH-quinone oxidoreductase subunit E
MAVDEEKQVLEGVREILDQKKEGYRNLISILQEVQNRFGYVPRQGMIEIAGHLGVSPANVFGVATFYNQFRFMPPGRRHVRVCMGTACHIKQGDLIMDQWKRRLEIEEGERTEDGEYSIERVACVGACAMAPVSIVCDEVIGEMAPTKVDGILLQHRINKEQEERKASKEKSQETLEGEE